MAAMSGNVALIDTLMRYSTDIMAVNMDRDTPLHVGLKHNQETFCLELINRIEKLRLGPKTIDIENKNDKMTPYFIAVLQGCFKVAKRLVSSGMCDA
jgi:ankyrin repeat protein